MENQVALPKFEDWRWPWTEGEVDEPKLARLVYNLKSDVDAHKTKVEEKDAEIATLTTDLDNAKAGKSGTDEEAQDKIKDLTKQVRDLEAAKGKSLPEDATKIAQLKVALELGLDPEDAERLRGKDFDELLEDGKDFAKRHGIELDENDDGSDGNQGPPPAGYPGQQPLSGLRTGGGNRRPAYVKPDPEAAKAKLPPLLH